MSVQQWECPDCGLKLEGDTEPGTIIKCPPSPKGCEGEWEVRTSLGAGFVFSVKNYYPKCPNCGQMVKISQGQPVGSEVECPNCHRPFPVTLELAPAPQEDEDWGE